MSKVDEIIIDHEHRLTRVEILLYVVAVLSGLQLVGIRIFSDFPLIGKFP